MEKRNNSPVFLVLLIISVALIVLLCVMNAKKEVDEYQDLQNTITVQEQNATTGTEEAVNAFREQTDAEYDNLDTQLDY